MSALELVTQGRFGTAYLGPCDNGCKAGIRGTSGRAKVRAGASHRVFICGYPAGVVCSDCATEMWEIWDGAK